MTRSPIDAELSVLRVAVGETNARWDEANDAGQVTVQLALDIKSAGERMCILLATLALCCKDHPEYLEKINVTYTTLRASLNDLIGFFEWHSCVDTLERLAPALDLAEGLVRDISPG